MTRLHADFVWRTEGPRSVRLDPRLLDLLRALEHSSTLRAAAADVALSYRAAWGLLLDATALLGAPLAELQRGRGARLTALGTTLLRNDERLREAMAPIGTRFAVSVDHGPASTAPPLRLVASHDPLLAEFCERYAVPNGIVEDISFRGSRDSLALYARGRVDMAGFHFADRSEALALRRFVRPGRDRLVRFVEREQGLIVAPGNPKQFATLADLAERRGRFVNRQRGSGTRMAIDRLLRESGTSPDRILGYGTEEFTHLAVAATVAAGRADAGFGVRAAAAQFDLDFIPMLQERYWFAVRERALTEVSTQRWLEALGGRPLARLARRLAGYRHDGAGVLYTVQEVFG